MTQLYEYQIYGVHVLFEVNDQQLIRLLHLSSAPIPDVEQLAEQRKRASVLVELQLTGFNSPGHKGTRLSNTLPGTELIFKHISQQADRLLITQIYEPGCSLIVDTHMQFFPGLRTVKVWSEITNTGAEPLGIEYISSLNVVGINSDHSALPYTANHVYLPHNSWTGENQWRKYSLPELGLLYALDGEKLQDSTKVIAVSNNSSWSCSQFAPIGVVENDYTGMATFWQIEHNGAWHWELTDAALGKQLALRLSGPTELHNHWWKNLLPGASFTTVPVAFGAVPGGWQAAIGELTQYRRTIRRPNADNRQLPVIFNDYMNCLSGDPTTAKELPLIDAAAMAGCEYFVIDCGWYSDGYWWDNVGEWQPSQARFPGGLIEVIDYIKSKGMIAGLWLEIEVMGINSKLAASLPDDWFFMRHGKRIIDHSRYHLDFRNSQVRDYATSVIQRLVNDYGIGYIKMDYNITTGIGSDVNSDSFGDGLLEHNRAYLQWLDHIFAMYPELVIENCGSGGMRHDYQMLARHSIQSITDQTEYVRNGAIAAACAANVTPEQAAIWSYPLREGDREEVIFNMVNTMLLRIHQSGHLGELTDDRLLLVKEAIDVYKTIRHHIAAGCPVWLTGIPLIDDEWFSFGIETPESLYLAVWRTESLNDHFTVHYPAQAIETVTQLYPNPMQDEHATHSVHEDTIHFHFKQNKIARLYEVRKVSNPV
ncbi:glycoside hydrolase family 36 protein [Paenibacillus campi]|uniref:glycoside hydrolase family 36 protein n=1 Tax=Paenibacillus campi TaxID=3106031 RepID=UPI002AFE1FEE|nr:glycoside hydrolase family 36 protein [Paenibacillus sp. SGZ-1009]